MAHTFEGHYPHVWSACWYPWAFWALVSGSRGRPSDSWLLPAVLALTFLTGHPQEWYLPGPGPDRLGRWPTRSGQVVAGSATGRGGAGRRLGRAAGAEPRGSCAVELVPELAVRPWLLEDERDPAGTCQPLSVPPAQPAPVAQPDGATAGRTITSATTITGRRSSRSAWSRWCSLAVGVAGYRDRALVWRWGRRWSASRWCSRRGGSSGLYSLAYAVLPGMDRFRVPSRSLFLATLAASVLAGAGVETLTGRTSRRRPGGLCGRGSGRGSWRPGSPRW